MPEIPSSVSPATPESPKAIPSTEPPSIDRCPVVIEQVVDWGDMDAFGHVNNVVYFRYFENARVEYFRRIGWWEMHQATGVGPIVSATNARFRRPVAYPATLRIGARLLSMGSDRFTLEHLAADSSGELTTIGDAVVVVFDYRGKSKVRIPDELAKRIAELEGQ